MTDFKNSYRQIFKVTSLFGGVQFVSIISSVIKTKVAALIIGVAGVGIFGVLNSTLNFIQALTRCGLDITAVKEIASSDKANFPLKVHLVKQLSLITGIIGVGVVLFFSPWLSQLAFSNKVYTVFFIASSVGILFNQLALGNMSILQGTKALKKLAKVLVFSSIVSLIPTVGIYYFFGEEGIPWVIVFTAFISFLISSYYVNKLKILREPTSLFNFTKNTRKILTSGFYLSLASVINLSIGFVIQIFVSNYGGLNEVGLYNAGFVLINSYVAVFFSALSKDFFPRLTEVSGDNKLVAKMVNEQAYMLLLLITPIIIIFLVFKPVIISLLYTKEFMPILGMITYGILATAFKGVSWSLGYILIAKGHSKLYLFAEIVSNILLLTSVFIGYILGGLTGLGIGYLVYHIVDLFFIKLIVANNYEFCFNKEFNQLFYISIIQFLIILALFYLENEIVKNILMALVVLFSVSITIFKLDAFFNLKGIIKNKLKKK